MRGVVEVTVWASAACPREYRHWSMFQSRSFLFRFPKLRSPPLHTRENKSVLESSYTRTCADTCAMYAQHIRAAHTRSTHTRSTHTRSTHARCAKGFPRGLPLPALPLSVSPSLALLHSLARSHSMCTVDGISRSHAHLLAQTGCNCHAAGGS